MECGGGACWGDLPREVVVRVARAAGPDWWAVLKEVEKQLRDVVDGLRAEPCGAGWKPRMKVANAASSVALLQWARAQGCPWNEATCEAAARGGHLQTLQWARAQGCPCGPEMLELLQGQGA